MSQAPQNADGAHIEVGRSVTVLVAQSYQATELVVGPQGQGITRELRGNH
ncbi:hypothetical protein [Streptomyces albidochromogenes]|nr:hypothetical protein [Streptomyces albidochromogenes]